MVHYCSYKIITDLLTYNIYSSIIPIAVNGSKILKDRIPMRQAREDERLRQNGYSQRKKGSEGMGGGMGGMERKTTKKK